MPIDDLIILSFAGLAGIGLFTAFVACERRGASVVPLAVVFVLLLVESSLWASQQDVTAGLFKLSAGDYSIRLPDLLIPAALAARVFVRGAPQRIGPPAIWLSLFAVWYATAGVVGLLDGHSFNEVVFEAKAIVYVGAGFALAAGIPIRQYLRGHGLERLAYLTAALAAMLAFMSQTDTVVDLPLPGAHSPTFGHFGADTASIFAAVGFLVAVVEVTRRPPRIHVMLTGGLLMLSVVFAEQRAAILGIVVSIAVLAAAWIAPAGRRRFRVTPTEIGVVALTLVAVALLPVVVSGIAGNEPSVPLSDTINETFYTEEDAQSADQRVGQFDAVREVIADRPITGYGLAQTFRYFATGINRWQTTPISHNITTDLLLRVGIVGLTLFAVPIVLVLVNGLEVWRSARDPRVAAFALGCVALAIGLLAKGQVESILEKFRLAVTLGFLLGIARSAALEVWAEQRRRERSEVTDTLTVSL